MRGETKPQPEMFSCVDLGARIPPKHWIRKIRRKVDEALSELEPAFGRMYSDRGRPSIPPEQLLRALLLQILFTIRSERLLIERINYDLLFRWSVGLGIDEAVWNHSVCSKNRDRLMAWEVDPLPFEAVKKQAYARRLMSRDHFTVDGTLIERVHRGSPFGRRIARETMTTVTIFTVRSGATIPMSRPRIRVGLSGCTSSGRGWFRSGPVRRRTRQRAG